MSTSAYAYGVSGCPDPSRICGPPDEQQACCPGPIGDAAGEYTCVENTVPDPDVWTCVAQGDPGGTCKNTGQGTSGCNQNSVKCNGNDNSNSCRCNQPNICGGYGSMCGLTSDCRPGYVCTDGWCKPYCDVNDACPANVVNTTSLVCVSNVCKQTCAQKSDCPSNSVGCVAGYCA